MREMEMKYLKSFVFVFLCLYDRLPYMEASSLDSRLTALENVFHNQIFLLREMVQRDTRQRDIFTQKMDKTLEFFEKFQNEILGSTNFEELKSKTDKLFTSGSDFKNEVMDTLVRHARGLQEEKKARKKDKEDIVTQIKKDKEDILTRINEDKEDIMIQIKEDKEDIMAQIKELLSAKMTEMRRIGEKCTNSEMTTEGTASTLETYQLTTSYEQITTREPVIRLVGGTGPHEGRVELLYEGSYGTVCDDWWDDRDATVACRMLGYHSGTEFFGPGTGQILLDDIKCSGNETSLFDCRNSGIGIHNCNHHEDAGVRCTVN